MDTPAVVIDHDILTANIERMATALRDRGVALRPHVKTHKIPEIAALQQQAGAVGITVATIGEAEVFIDGGADDVFIAYPLWLTERSAERLRQLASRATVAVGLDSIESAVRLADMLGADKDKIEVVLELDSGHHRSGTDPADVVAVAKSAVTLGLRIRGVFTFPGHSYGPGRQAEAAHHESQALTVAAAALAAAGINVTVRSGGSTPSVAFTESGATEVRPGVYVFGDAQQWELGTCEPDDIALAILATVVSRRDTSRQVILDCGSKILGSDRPAWLTGFGRLRDHPDARITALSEHHATIDWLVGEPLPALGTRLAVIPNHVCLVLNLVDEVFLTGSSRPTDRWLVPARGKNS